MECDMLEGGKARKKQRKTGRKRKGNGRDLKTMQDFSRVATGSPVLKGLQALKANVMVLCLTPFHILSPIFSLQSSNEQDEELDLTENSKWLHRCCMNVNFKSRIMP